MLNPPPDLSEPDAVAALAAGWGVHVESMTYRPVGFGSHHWEVTDRAGTRWFATVDENPDLRRLNAALLSAADVPVAVAPLLTAAGGPLVEVGRFAVSIYPFLPGETFHFGDYRDDAHRRATLDMVVEVHRTQARHALTDDLTAPPIPPIPDSGPYAARARTLFAEEAEAIAALQARCDSLASRVDPARFVLTHGEPHPGNTMHTADGWRLIDWDTALIAPPERDLWHLATPDTLTAYEQATGVHPDPEVLELYRLRWDLTELSECATQFARPHTGDANDAMTWQILTEVAQAAAGPRNPA